MPNMTARSVVLSVLLGAHPAWASASELIRLTADFGIKETTLRVALTRMVGAGDLIRSADGYRLSDRLLARQRRQDEAMRPRSRPWRGDWLVLVVTSVGTDARTRAALRTTMHDKRFGELREGVWMRPDNLDPDLGPDVSARVRVLKARDEAPAALAGELWDLLLTFPVGSWWPRRSCVTCSPTRCCRPSCCPPIGPAPGCAPLTTTSPPNWRSDVTQPNSWR
jgi:phenylacetic acid degradation operon negative regulatory protein